MSDLDRLLNDCLESIRSGATTSAEWLQRHPQEAAQLRPLLEAAAFLQRGRLVQPSADATGRVAARLVAHMRARSMHVIASEAKQSPQLREEGSRRPASPSHHRRLAPATRLAGILAGLLLAALVPITAWAQSALPGNALYTWKLLSERAWRAAASDTVGADMQQADRRLSEILLVKDDPQRLSMTLQLYEETILRLMDEAAPEDGARISALLLRHQKALSAAGIVVPELEFQLQQLAPSLQEPLPPDLIPPLIPLPQPLDPLGPLIEDLLDLLP